MSTTTEQKKKLENEPTADYGTDASYLKTLSQLDAEGDTALYGGSYDTQLKTLYGDLMGREDFSYQPDEDRLYQAYRDQYTNQGKLAMRDTLGAAAGLTGGYSSSYAQSAGQQQYDAYLTRLNELLPELYSAAADNYDRQGQQLSERYALTQSAAQAEKAARDQTREELMYMMLQTGYAPNDEELAAAGLSEEQSRLLQTKFYRDNKLPLPVELGGAAPSASSGGSGGSYSNYEWSEAKGLTKAQKIAIQRNLGVRADGIWGNQTHAAWVADNSKKTKGGGGR